MAWRAWAAGSLRMTAALAEEARDFVVCAHQCGETAVAAIHAGAADFVSRDHVDCLGVVVARCLRHQRAARPGLGVGYVQSYVIGHPAPIAGLLEECAPCLT